MDNKNEGFLMIGTAMVVLLAFAVTIIAVMIIYRKRKMEHIKEVDTMNDRFAAELLRTQLESQQQTMQHIGREIHDNVGQKLTLATIYAQQLDTTAADEKSAKKINSIASILQESLADLRSLSKNLANADSVSAELYTLISSECNKVQATGLCTVIFNHNTTSLEVSPATANFVLRILQEFMQNSLKHSKCSNIIIGLKKSGEAVQITAWDNGSGFIINGEAMKKGIGLGNMQKRSEMIGAAFEISSSTQGTKMSLSIPADKYYL